MLAKDEPPSCKNYGVHLSVCHDFKTAICDAARTLALLCIVSIGAVRITSRTRPVVIAVHLEMLKSYLVRPGWKEVYIPTQFN